MRDALRFRPALWVQGIAFLALSLASGSPALAESPPPTIVRDSTSLARLVGNHALLLPSIDVDYLGKATVVDCGGTLELSGQQKDWYTHNYVKIKGVITVVQRNEFRFVGKLITQHRDRNFGRPVVRSGRFQFVYEPKRRGWQLVAAPKPTWIDPDEVNFWWSGNNHLE